ncbi:hypothetical protein ABIF38_008507 [Bradyrhizobium japonicum]|uniref:hypothetical protein n=1 Tax=Bradyrhizobium TaxID=374 RepID=UPI00114269C3|nr:MULTISPECIES: hypothetical protein [Bradyrhizobium]MCP1729180.1 hypothetical protein [Bradyrhizobium elkanii]MCS3573309.1 hypothetical protein [Bradyrhizobium elkanii]MCS3594000.1 hypothetical protein [Bradyrhizobium elkanii]MCS3623446.1 hypothetical protein [Bradyrhizobium elkanii]UQD79707.1 hypothetical protein JEY66_33165 [Bradyrhizobium elkanii USDA 76]
MNYVNRDDQLWTSTTWLPRRTENGPNQGAANPSDTGFPPAVGGRLNKLGAVSRLVAKPIVPINEDQDHRRYEYEIGQTAKIESAIIFGI